MDIAGERSAVADMDEYKRVVKAIMDSRYASLISAVKAMPLQPMSRRFGLERGKAIDRRYIEDFLEKNRQDVKGDVMEIGDDAYTVQYGGEKVENSYVLHVEGYGKNVVKGNLETGEGIVPGTVDCLICTQTIQMIYSMDRVVDSIYNTLKDHGAALVTAHCISQLSMSDYLRWGEYWRFTPKALKRLFADRFGADNVEVEFYGNVKTAAAFLYGLCVEDMEESDFEYQDEQYPVMVVVRAKKE